MFAADDPRNDELLLEMGRRGHFPPSESINLGTHYDLIRYLWHDLNSQLKEDSRWIVAFRPALVHPKTGVAFAIGRGTEYFIRIPESKRTDYLSDLREWSLKNAERIGLDPSSIDRYVDHRLEPSAIGPVWMRGWYLPNEIDYLRF